MSGLELLLGPLARLIAILVHPFLQLVTQVHNPWEQLLFHLRPTFLLDTQLKERFKLENNRQDGHCSTGGGKVSNVIVSTLGNTFGLEEGRRQVTVISYVPYTSMGVTYGWVWHKFQAKTLQKKITLIALYC